MAKPRVVILIVAILVSGVGAYALWWNMHVFERAHRGSFAITKDSITIKTAPIPVLAPHTHTVSDTQVDTASSPGHGVYALSGTFAVPYDMWVTDITTVVENAPPPIIHHALLFRQDRMDPICPNRHEQIMVVGADTAPSLTLPSPYGVFLKKGTRIYVHAMAHNPTPPLGSGDTYTNVAIGFRLTYERAAHTDRTRPVALYRIFIDDHPEYCSKPISDTSLLTDSYTIPPSVGTYTRTTPTGSSGATARLVFPTTGTLVYIGAHTHPNDGGKNVSLFLNGTLLGSFTPTQTDPRPWVWLTPKERIERRVSLGDTLTVSSTYHNPHPLPILGAMGMGVFVFAPDNGASLLK